MKNHLVECWECLSFILDFGSYIVSIAGPTKIGALIRSKMFLSLEVTLCLFNITVVHEMLLSCMERCFKLLHGNVG